MAFICLVIGFMGATVGALDWPYSCKAGDFVGDVDVDLHGKTVFLTGSDGQIGYPLAKKLASAGATLIAASRTMEHAIANKQRLETDISIPITVETLAMDGSSFDSVRQGATSTLAKHKVIDIVIHMAGTSHGAGNVTVDGFNLPSQVNHLSSVLLTKLLLPALKRSSSPRVVYIASASMFLPVENWKPDSVVQQTMRWIRGSPPKDLFMDDARAFYFGLSKLLVADYAAEQAKRLPELTIFAVNPGFARTDADNKTKYADMCDNSQLTKPCPQFPAQAATSTLFAATQRGIEGASGSLLDFETKVVPISDSNPSGFLQLDSDSCIPRPLPERAINSHMSEWYEAVDALFDEQITSVVV